MDDLTDRLREALAGAEGWLVGGALRDELLGRSVIDLDVACREPELAARAFARASGGAPFPLSERHGAWRIALEDRRTVDFTPLAAAIEDDLGTRDFTLNAMARPVGGGDLVDPFGGQEDIAGRTIRAVTDGVFEADPLRLVRAVRLEDELGFRCDDRTEELLRRHAPLAARPAGERILGELERLSGAGFRRLAELGLLDALGGSDRLFDRIDTGRLTRLPSRVRIRRASLPSFRSRAASTGTRARCFGPSLRPMSPRGRSTASGVRRSRGRLDALAFLGMAELRPVIEEARVHDPPAPLLRGDELGLPPGPEIGKLLSLIAEERAAGTITTRKDALAFVEAYKSR